MILCQLSRLISSPCGCTSAQRFVVSEKNAYKSVKTALLLSNIIDADHQNSCLFTNKGHFSSSLWVLIGILDKFYELYFTNSCNWVTLQKCPPPLKTQNKHENTFFCHLSSSNSTICGMCMFLLLSPFRICDT